jgi:hypothetical protein
MPDETSEDSVLGKIGTAFHTFYPLIVSVVHTPIIVKFQVPWFGLALGVVLFALKRTWWTCIFGLLNAMAVLAMMIACVVAWIASSKDEANKTLTPDPPPVLAAMTATTSTPCSILAPGQA